MTHCDGKKEGSSSIKSLNEEVTKCLGSVLIKVIKYEIGSCPYENVISIKINLVLPGNVFCYVLYGFLSMHLNFLIYGVQGTYTLMPHKCTSVALSNTVLHSTGLC